MIVSTGWVQYSAGVIEVSRVHPVELSEVPENLMGVLIRDGFVVEYRVEDARPPVIQRMFQRR